MSEVGDTGFDWADIVDDVVERSGGQTASASDILSIRRSLRLLLERWNASGYNLWKIGEATIAASGGAPALPLPDDLDDIIQIMAVPTGSPAGAAPLTRKSEAEYANISRKTVAGQPTLFCLRRSEPPCLLIYPVPDVTSYDLQITYVQRPERFQRYDYIDSGSVAGRWLGALVHGLALDRARKSPPYDENLISRLTSESGEAERLAQMGDRGRQRYRYRIG